MTPQGAYQDAQDPVVLHLAKRVAGHVRARTTERSPLFVKSVFQILNSSVLGNVSRMAAWLSFQRR